MSKQYWLMKTEPNVFSIETLKKQGKTHWEGVRNYQARNYMRDSMKVDDLVLIYHSNATPPGIAGLARVASEAYPDFFAFDPKSKYFDPKSKKDNPTWMMVDIEYIETFNSFISLNELKKNSDLEGMLVIKKGQRLSIMPVQEKHFKTVVHQAKTKI